MWVKYAMLRLSPSGDLCLNSDRLVRETHDLTGDDFAALTRFDMVVDAHVAVGDELFGGGAAVAPAEEFQQIAQFNVRMLVQVKNFHNLSLCLCG